LSNNNFNISIKIHVLPTWIFLFLDFNSGLTSLFKMHSERFVEAISIQKESKINVLHYKIKFVSLSGIF